MAQVVWNSSSCKPRTYLFYIVNVMAADDLATQGVRVPATMIFTIRCLLLLLNVNRRPRMTLVTSKRKNKYTWIFSRALFHYKCHLAITESHCENKTTLRSSYRHLYIETALVLIPLYSCCNMPSQIAKFMGPTWGQPGSCRPQMCPMLAPWTLLSGVYCFVVVSNEHIFSHIPVNTCEHFDTLITLTCNKVI